MKREVTASKSGGTQFGGQLARANLRPLGGKQTARGSIFNACGSSLTQPEHENDRGKPE
jgi:hypothetical protein